MNSSSNCSCSFRDKTEEGLKTENAEIQCIPTFIAPKTTHIKGKSLVLDLGGTNYRVAIVDFDKATPTVHPNNGWKRHVNYSPSDIPAKSYSKNWPI